MQQARLLARLQREIIMLKTDPPPGVCAWPHNDMLTHLEAQLQGPANTVYSRGLFKLDVQVPERYPFEPPSVRFVTPIYHPNIDSGGRICLDILNMPPKGAWKPSLNILTVLVSIGSLLSEPNPDDGLMGDITAEYKHHRSSFDRKARQMTEQHALPSLLHDSGDQAKTITPSIPKVSSLAPSSEAKCVTKLLPGVDQPDSGNQASSGGDQSSKMREVAGPSPLKQRLALGRKLSLSKPEQPLADVKSKDPTPIRSLKVDEHEDPAGQAVNRSITTIKQQTEDALQPAQQKTALDCKATPEAQSMGTSLPLSKEVTLAPPKPVKDECAKPSRLSLLSRLKTSRPRLSQQKAAPSSTQPSLFVIQAADCTVVSDSESEDEEIPVSRGRLSLAQSRTHAGKRKASLIA